MKNVLGVMSFLCILGSQSLAQVNETTPTGQDRGGAPAMQQMSGQANVKLPKPSNGKLLPFYSLTATSKRSSLKCRGKYTVNVGGAPQGNMSPVPVDLTCRNSNDKFECDTKVLGDGIRPEEVSKSASKLMSSMPGLALDYYLSEARVNKLKSAKLVAGVWTVKHKDHTYQINPEMTEMTSAGAPVKYKLQTIDDMLFVTEYNIDAKETRGLTAVLSLSFQKDGSVYYPKTIVADVKAAGMKQVMKFELEKCASH